MACAEVWLCRLILAHPAVGYWLSLQISIVIWSWDRFASILSVRFGVGVRFGIRVRAVLLARQHDPLDGQAAELRLGSSCLCRIRLRLHAVRGVSHPGTRIVIGEVLVVRPIAVTRARRGFILACPTVLLASGSSASGQVAVNLQSVDSEVASGNSVAKLVLIEGTP